MQRIVLIAACLLGASSVARAQDWRPYVFSLDGLTLNAKRAALEAGAGYNGVTGAGGGLQPDDARRTTAWVSAAVGLTDRVELSGAFLFGDDPTNGAGFNQARIDLRVRLLNPRKRFPVAISAGAGYQADALIEHAITANLAATAFIGRVNLTVNVRAAHYFHTGRDPVDVFVTAGALVRATNWLRVGAEYVGEELEGVFGADLDDAIGGRHYVGPTAALFFVDNKLRLNATAGPVFTQAQTGMLARASLAYLF